MSQQEKCKVSSLFQRCSVRDCATSRIVHTVTFSDLNDLLVDVVSYSAISVQVT